MLGDRFSNRQTISLEINLNSIISDIDKTHNKEEKEIKKDILQQLLQDYKLYKINKTMDDVMDTGK